MSTTGRFVLSRPPVSEKCYSPPPHTLFTKKLTGITFMWTFTRPTHLRMHTTITPQTLRSHTSTLCIFKDCKIVRQYKLYSLLQIIWLDSGASKITLEIYEPSALKMTKLHRKPLYSLHHINWTPFVNWPWVNFFFFSFFISNLE